MAKTLLGANETVDEWGTYKNDCPARGANDG